MLAKHFIAVTLLGVVAVTAQQPERFVAIVRNGEDVRIWDVPNGQPATSRVELGESSWAPSPLLDSAKLLRWQVPPAPQGKRRHYDVKLLRVDYRTFEVTELTQMAQAQAIGGAGGLVYLRTSKGPLMLDVAAGDMFAIEPMNLLARSDDDWLIETGGVVARFDAANNEIVKRYPKIAASDRSWGRPWTVWDGGRFAVCNGAFFDEEGKPVRGLGFMEQTVVYRDLRVWDLDQGTESSMRVRTQAMGGSGEPIIPMPMPTELVGGMFRYAERRPAEGKHSDVDDYELERDAEWVTIDIATGKELLRVPYQPRNLKTPDPMDVNRVPEYLREGFAASPVRAWGAKHDLAHAFLEHKGIDPALPKTGVCKFDGVARSADGNRLLVLLRGTLYGCDLQAKTIAKWAAPAAWKDAMVELYAVD